MRPSPAVEGSHGGRYGGGRTRTETVMKRLIATMVTMAAVSVTAAACGSGDDAAVDEPPAENSTAAADEAGADEPAGTDDTVVDEPAAGEQTASDAAGMITSFDDIPQECLDLTAEFLRTIEPIVSSIDWENATMNDFEMIADDFEAEAEAFDIESAEACGSIDLAEDGMSVMIEFARDEAPGTVGFLGFMEQLQNVALGLQPGGESASFVDCAEAIDFIDELMVSYTEALEVPVDAVVRLASITDVIMSCTPEELEFFDRPEVAAFFGE